MFDAMGLTDVSGDLRGLDPVIDATTAAAARAAESTAWSTAGTSGSEFWVPTTGYIRGLAETIWNAVESTEDALNAAPANRDEYDAPTEPIDGDARADIVTAVVAAIAGALALT